MGLETISISVSFLSLLSSPLHRDHVLLGLGSLNLMLGRIVRFSRDKVAFMTLVSAAALRYGLGLACSVFFSVMQTVNKKFLTYSSNIYIVLEASSYCPYFDGISNFCAGA